MQKRKALVTNMRKMVNLGGWRLGVEVGCGGWGWRLGCGMANIGLFSVPPNTDLLPKSLLSFIVTIYVPY